MYLMMLAAYPAYVSHKSLNYNRTLDLGPKKCSGCALAEAYRMCITPMAGVCYT
jgi:hypothetical protein